MTTAEYQRFPDTETDNAMDQEIEETEGLTTSNSSCDGSIEQHQEDLVHTTLSQQDTRRKIQAVVLFSVTTILLFADQNLLSPNLSAIADEFHFSNDERDRKLGGDIALAFFLLGAPASFLVGCLADQSDRSVLFAITVGIGEGACLATYFTRTYLGLYTCRAITGFSVGGALPLIYSILGDLFAAEDRHATSAVVGIGTGAGIAFGQGVAGFLGPTFGWRVPFLVVSIPALICALLVFFTVPDPERGGMERTVLDMRQHEEARHELTRESLESSIEIQRLNRNDGDEDDSPGESSNEMMVNEDNGRLKHRKTSSSSLQPVEPKQDGIYDDDCDEHAPSLQLDSRSSFGQDWKSHFITFFSLLSCPTVLLAFFQGAPGCLPWGIVNSYLNDFLSEDRGMTVEGATATVLCFGVGNFFGLVLGGMGGRVLYKLDPRYPALLAGFSTLLACIPFYLLLTTIDASSHSVYLVTVTFLGGLLTGATGPIIKATLTNVTLPTTRGQAFAIYNLFDDFGKGLGPVFISLLIVHLGGRTPAFCYGVLGWVFCGILNLSVFFTVAKDEQNVQATLAATLRESHTVDGVKETTVQSLIADSEAAFT